MAATFLLSHTKFTDICHWLDGSEFMGERLVVQFARGSTRPRDDHGFGAPRQAPRPRRTVHRMTITGLPFETSWQVSNLIQLLPSPVSTSTTTHLGVLLDPVLCMYGSKLIPDLGPERLRASVRT